ncbi:conserved hypothetical protein [Cyanobium sp. PCC 7001]|nr:conserved hypothetical protein [Cyanobium sp. PCC 7001]
MIPSLELLSTVGFTSQADTARSIIGWLVPTADRVTTRAGNDKIVAQGDASGLVGITNFGLILTGRGNDRIKATGGTLATGLLNSGRIKTGQGEDLVRGLGNGDNRAGLWNGNGGEILTGAGKDRIQGLGSPASGTPGIVNVNGSVINTGSGIDILKGVSIATGIQNSDFSVINTGAGSDRIQGQGWSFGLQISRNARVLTGIGNDRILGTSDPRSSGESVGILLKDGAQIQTGNGRDQITGNSTGNGNPDDNAGILITSSSQIKTARGNDRITGIGTAGSSGVHNDALIDTGKGKDVVNALQGGFAGTGRTRLGQDNDRLLGFGTGFFEGGGGKNDKIFLGQGSYAVNRAAGTITSSGQTMNIRGFEIIGGSSRGSFALKSGTFNVTAAGLGSFI